MSSISNERILHLAEELWEGRGGLTVEMIDGAFYWRICRGELIDTLEALIHDMSKQDSTGPFIGKDLDQAKKLFDHMYALESVIPNLSAWITQGLSPVMRDPLFSWYSRRPSSIPCFQPGYVTKTSGIWMFLGVRNSWWQGVDVERELRARVRQVEEHNANYLEQSDSSSLMQEESAAFMDLKFYHAGELQIKTEWDELPGGDPRWATVESPVIMYSVSYPLPSEGLIGAMYDAVAIQQYGWNRKLYGAGSSPGTTVEVAIRTWTMGLLTGLGVNSHQVARLTDPLFGQPVTPQAFGEQRKELVRRVPEAERFVYQRRR